MSSKKHSVPVRAVAAGGHGIMNIVRLAIKLVLSVLLVIFTTALLFTCIFAIYVKTTLTDELDVNLSEFNLDLTSEIYYEDSNGEWQQLTTLYGNENRVWVDYADLPQYLEKATVAIEDKRFYEHNGVDWYRTVAAFGNMFLTMKDNFGASTITQQLIKNLTEYDDVTVKRKLVEIFRALEFEKTYTKEQIIEWYLNSIYLGEGCWGVGSASLEYFGKEVGELTIAECAALIGITNNPSMYDPYINQTSNRKRQLTILSEMLSQEYITKEQYDQAVAQKMVFQSADTGEEEQQSDGPTSWYVDALIEEVIGDLMELKNCSYKTAEQLLFRSGYKIYASIDMDIQNIVDEIYCDQANMPSGYVQSESQKLQSAIVVENPYTGDIVALAGSMGEKDGSRLFNFATDMKRPPGSSIKPIAVYGPAIELGLIEPYTTFNDAGSDQVTLSGTTWYPNNDSYSYSGLVTVRQAVTRSINTVAAQIMDLITPTTAFNFVRDRMGLSTLVDSDMGYAPMALGQLTEGATVADMASAYTAFVNNGIRTTGRTYSMVLDSNGEVVISNTPKSVVALSESTAYQVTDMLQNVVNAGTAGNARLSNMPAAGKTGASSGWKDRWFVGYTPYYVAAVWTGYETPEYMGSSNPSVILWQRVMAKVHENLETKSFEVPEGMTRVTVCIDSGLLATDACKADMRGDHTLTLYVSDDEAPRSYCDCHTMTKVCSVSHELPCKDCPEADLVEVGVLDLEGVSEHILTPEYKDGEGNVIVYVLADMRECSKHLIDPETGWLIDPETGYVINPVTGQLYDKATGKRYDQYSRWEIDTKTGYIINPETGKLRNPWTGEEIDPEPEPSDDPSVTDDPFTTDDPNVSHDPNDRPYDPDNPDVTDSPHVTEPGTTDAPYDPGEEPTAPGGFRPNAA